MTTSQPKILSVVPQQHQWLRTLVDALSRAGVPWRYAVLAERMIRIRASAESQPPFIIVVRPLDAGLPGFKSTSLFVIGYDGARDLSSAQRQWLGQFHELLSCFESALPPGLEGFDSVGIRQGPPEDILRGLFPVVTVERSQAANLGEIVEVLVRATSRCNQACPFCSAPRHDEPTSEILWACLKAAADLLPGAMVSLTGGEPTLRPAFLVEVEAALRLDFCQVQVQTNAVRFADRLDPGSLPKNDKLSFFVSLHAWDPEIYDRCTQTSGQLPRAQKGLLRILDAGHAVIVNKVINSENIDHLEEMVRNFAGKFAGENPPVLHFSVLICPEWNQEARRGQGRDDFPVRTMWNLVLTFLLTGHISWASHLRGLHRNRDLAALCHAGQWEEYMPISETG